MILQSDARAVVTLGPRMPRDKFMQAAGRLRQLAKEQSLVIVATMEVCRLVQEQCDIATVDSIEPHHIVQWVHANSIAQVAEVCPTALQHLRGGSHSKRVFGGRPPLYVYPAGL